MSQIMRSTNNYAIREAINMQKFHALGIVLATLLAASMPLQARETQILACSYYDKLDNSANSSFFHRGLPWVWAKGLEGENIYAEGQKVDGFFEISALTGSQLLGTYENSTKSARALCAQALIEAFPDNFQNKVVMNMMVKSSFLSFNHSPPLFPNLTPEKNPQEIRKIIIFGDSLSDQDNMKSWIRVLPGPPYFGGRFTNGPNWVDFLHLETGVAIQNWAVGGAITRTLENEEHRLSTLMAGSVEDEINNFKEVVGEGKSISNPNTTLFIVWAGGNDYLSKLFSEKEINAFVDEPNNPKWGSNLTTKKVTNNIINHLENLYAMGGRKFVVVNMPDLGSLPQALYLEHYHYEKNDKNKLLKLSRRLSQITLQHNQELVTRVEAFKKEYPDVQIIYGDTYTGLRNVVLSRHYLNPSRYFSYQLDPDFIIELRGGKRPVQIHRACFTGSIWGINLCSTTCANPERNLFWDKIHPTSFGHCLVALNLQKRLHINNLMSAPEANNYFQRCQPTLVVN